jgi:hypothetical protein
MKYLCLIGLVCLLLCLAITGEAVQRQYRPGMQPVLSWHVFYWERTSGTWQPAPQMAFLTWKAAYQYANVRYVHYRIYSQRRHPAWVVQFLSQ